METKLLFEYRWFPSLFEACKDEGLDWLRMSAIALVLSSGDPRAREIDWVFLDTKIGPENPLFTGFYNGQEQPMAQVIDRATKWGLFQIHGQVAVEMGFKGRLVNFIDIGINTRMACRIMAGLLKDSAPQEAEQRFGVSSVLVDETVRDLRLSISELLSISEEVYGEGIAG